MIMRGYIVKNMNTLAGNATKLLGLGLNFYNS